MNAKMGQGPGAVELYAGYAKKSILPPEGRVVQLQGQSDLRICDRHNRDSDIFTSVMVLESRIDGVTREVSVWVGLDLTCGTQHAATKIAGKLRARGLTAIAPEKIMVSATHTHRAPFALYTNKWDKLGFPYHLRDADLTDGGIPNLLTPEEYIDNQQGTVAGWDGYLGLTADAIVEAWNLRERASVGVGTVQCNFGNPRFTLVWDEEQNKVFANGFEQYADVNGPNYRGVLNQGTDWDVQTIGFWSRIGGLIGLVAGVHAPAQIDDKSTRISADYWKDVRSLLPSKLGLDGEVPLVPWCLTAGDLGIGNPFVYGGTDEHGVKRGKRYTYSEAGELVSNAIGDAYVLAIRDRRSNVELKHGKIAVPLRLKKLTEAQYIEAKDWLAFFRQKYRRYLDYTADPEYGLNTWKWTAKLETDSQPVELMTIRKAGGIVELHDPNRPGVPNEACWWEPFAIRSARAIINIYEKQSAQGGTATETYTGHAIVLGHIGIGSFCAEMYVPHSWMLKSWVKLRTVIPVQLEGFDGEVAMGYVNNPEAEAIASYGNSADMGAVDTGEGITFTRALASAMNEISGFAPVHDYSRVAIISGGLTGYYLAPDGYTELVGDKSQLGVSAHPGTNDVLGTVLGVGTVRQFNWGGYAEFAGVAPEKRPKIYAFANDRRWLHEREESGKSYDQLVRRIKRDMGADPQKIVIDQGWTGHVDVTVTQRLVDCAGQQYPNADIYVMNAVAIARSAPRQNFAQYPYNSWYNWRSAEDMDWVAGLKDQSKVNQYNDLLASVVYNSGGRVQLIDVNEASGLKGDDGYLREDCAAMNGFGQQLSPNGIRLLGDLMVDRIRS